ncbi:unnamed protein product, partial [Mesorhabditis spiculigera]
MAYIMALRKRTGYDSSFSFTLLFWIGVVDLVQLFGHTHAAIMLLTLGRINELAFIIGAFVEAGFFMTGFLTMLLPIHRFIYILWAVRAPMIAKPGILRVILRFYLGVAIFWVPYFLPVTPIAFLPEISHPRNRLIIHFVSEMVWVMYNGANPVIYLVFHRSMSFNSDLLKANYIWFPNPYIYYNFTNGTQIATVEARLAYGSIKFVLSLVLFIFEIAYLMSLRKRMGYDSKFSFTLLFYIGIADLLQLLCHLISGFMLMCLMSSSEWTYVYWGFTYNKLKPDLNTYMRIVEEWSVLAPIVIGAFLYSCIIVTLCYRIFAVLIVCTICYVMWYRFLDAIRTDDQHFKRFLSDLVFVVYNGMNPLIYFLFHRIVVLYENKFGLWPEIEGGVNGGIPQKADLDAHLKKAKTDLKTLVPDPNFDGIIVIDMEHWLPVFEMNWDKKEPYRVASMKYARAKYDVEEMSKSKHTKYAKKEFDKAARLLIKSTIKSIRKWRPKAKIGFYGFPYVTTAIGKAGASSHASDITRKGNDQLDWLFDLLDYLMPSIYHYQDKKFNDFIHVRGTLEETLRVQKTHNKPILAYTKFERIPYGKTSQMYYDESALCSSIQLAWQMGAAGLIFWSTDKAMKERCPALSTYVNDKLIPYLKKEVNAAEDCAQEMCGGHGRCYTEKVYNLDSCRTFKNSEMKCRCDKGRRGSKCEKQTML